MWWWSNFSLLFLVGVGVAREEVGFDAFDFEGFEHFLENFDHRLRAGNIEDGVVVVGNLGFD